MTPMTALFGSALLAGSMWVSTHRPAPTVAAPIFVSDEATPLPAPRPVDPRTYVAQRASRHGWTLTQWRCAARLVQRESGWRVSAVNGQGSSAYGLFQILHTPKGTPLHEQVDRFLRYVESRYDDDPCAALRHSLENGWY